MQKTSPTTSKIHQKTSSFSEPIKSAGYCDITDPNQGRSIQLPCLSPNPSTYICCKSIYLYISSTAFKILLNIHQCQITQDVLYFLYCHECLLELDRRKLSCKPQRSGEEQTLPPCVWWCNDTNNFCLSEMSQLQNFA